MKFTKQIAIFILVVFGVFTFQPVLARDFSIEPETLQEFLKTTEEIKIAYSWDKQSTQRGLDSTVILPAGTPITVRALSTIKSSEIKSGDTVNFTVNSDVRTREGYVIVKAGTAVSAEIIFSKAKGKVGKSGNIQISNFHTTTIDGSYVPLSATLSSEPEDNLVTSILLSVFICPLFLLMEGEDAAIHAGKTQISYTHSDVYVNKNDLINSINKYENIPVKNTPASNPRQVSDITIE